MPREASHAGFLHKLHTGELGLRLRMPGSLNPIAEGPGDAWLSDDTRAVLWHVSVLAVALDVHREYDEILRSDVRMAVQELAQMCDGARASERSPLIDLDHASIAGVDGLQCLYRTPRGRSHELVIGEILIPMACGTARISVTARAARPVDELAAEPLERVRSALAWLRTEADIEVTAPAQPDACHEILLMSARCAISPPPRYLPAPYLSAGRRPGQVCFTRVCPPGPAVRSLDIWRTPGAPITGAVPGWRLALRARMTLRKWRRDGVTHLRYSAMRRWECDGRAQVEFAIRFRVQDIPRVSVQRWFIGRAGQVYRIAAGASPSVPVRALVGDVDWVARSWRALD